MYEAVEDKDKDVSFLSSVLEALQEKEKTEESKMEKASKLCCGKADETEEAPEEKRKKENQEEILTKGLQKLEDAIVCFSKEVGDEIEASPHQEISAEVEDMRERIIFFKDELEGEKKSVAPLWDTPNEQGDTALHLSVALKNPEATSLLLDFQVDPNIPDRNGKTPLHLACDQVDIEQATKLVKHKVLVIDMLFAYLVFILINLCVNQLLAGKNAPGPIERDPSVGESFR